MKPFAFVIRLILTAAFSLNDGPPVRRAPLSDSFSFPLYHRVHWAVAGDVPLKNRSFIHSDAPPCPPRSVCFRTTKHTKSTKESETEAVDAISQFGHVEVYP
jgi:hypothetical protein